MIVAVLGAWQDPPISGTGQGGGEVRGTPSTASRGRAWPSPPCTGSVMAHLVGDAATAASQRG